MTVQECYNKMNGNYGEVLERLGMDRIIEKFLLKFPKDESMNQLLDAIKDGDIEGSFKAAHTLKGVAANLAFTELQKATDALTEQLRPKNEQANPTLVAAVEKAYSNTIAAIEEYQQVNA